MAQLKVDQDKLLQRVSGCVRAQLVKKNYVSYTMQKQKKELDYTKETYSSKEEWLKARAFGGSSASAIMGVNPYMSKLELYRAVVMPSNHPIVKENESMYYGTKCEPLIRKLFAYDHKDKYLVHTPKNYEMYRRKDKPYMTATLDGILREKGTGKKGVLEIKTHDIRNREDERNWSAHIPQNYYVQVLHYMLVMSDFEFAVLTAKLKFYDFFDPDGKKLLKTEIRYFYIDRKDEQVQKDLALLERKETEFWEHNIQKKIMPSIKLKF